MCKLKKSIHGLEEASRQWNEGLNKFLIGIGFVQIESDRYAYSRGSFILMNHADDRLSCSDDEEGMCWIINAI